MAQKNESFNKDLFNLLKVRGYDPVPLDSKNQRVSVSQDSDVIQFTFKKDGKDYGKVLVTVDDAHTIIIYYDEEQQDSPSTRTPGLEYDDSWTGLLKFLKMWAQRRQMSFELSNKDRLGDDMRQREYYRMKEKLGENRFFSSKRPYSCGLTFKDMDRLSESARGDSKAFHRNIVKNLAHRNLPGNFNTLEMFGIYARHLVENKNIPDNKKNRRSDAEKEMFRTFIARAVDNVKYAKVGDKIALLHLSTVNIPGLKVLARLDGFLSPKTVTKIEQHPDASDPEIKLITFDDGDTYPKSDVRDIYTITQGWNMTRLFDSYDTASKAFMLYSLLGNEVSDDIQFTIGRVNKDNNEMTENLGEGYYPIGKKASYNDAVPNVKIVLQHNRALEEGEQRYRNVARIFLENADGERFLAPTNKPGIARVYARHIAEGGLPNDDRWNHIKSVCEDYTKMAGFVRATKNKQFNESTQHLIQEGIEHYNAIRESLHKLTTHKGYHAYFESYTPALLEGEGEDISEMFMSSSMDPRIEAAMPILSRLHKPVTEMNEVGALANWADSIISEADGLEAINPVGIPESGISPTKKKFKCVIPGKEATEFEAETKEEAKKLAAKEWKVDPDKVKIDDDSDTKKKPVDPESSMPDTSEMNPVERAHTLAHHKIKSRKSGGIRKLVGAATSISETESIYKKHGMQDYEMSQRSSLKNINPDLKDIEKGDELKEMDKDKQGADYKAWRKKNFNDKKTTDDIIKGSGTRTKYDIAENFIGMAPQAVAEEEDEDDIEEGLDANQKRVGQLGPTERVRNNNIGKLVGANESMEMDPDLARIIEMAKFKR